MILGVSVDSGGILLAATGLKLQWVLAPIAGALVVFLLQLAGRKEPLQVEGWMVLVPGLSSWVFAIFCIFFAGLLTFVTAATLQDMTRHPQAPVEWSRVFVPPVIALLAIFTAGYLIFVRFRFNDNGVERQFLLRRVFIKWSEIARIKRHWFLGPQIQCRDGRIYYVWDIWRGFQSLIETARKHGIKIDL